MLKCKCGKTTNYGSLCISCSQSTGIEPDDPISYEEMMEVIEEDEETEEWVRKEFQKRLEES